MSNQIPNWIKGIDHPAVAVKDVKGMSEWYTAVLGYQIKYYDESKPVALLQAVDGSYLEVMSQDQTPRPYRTNWTPGWSHLALRVHNLDEAIRDLNQAQVNWAGEVGSAVGGGRLRSFYDPEGNLWQLVER